ncbi:MAG: hypothetical protein D3906_07140 [Candidatus Electrothrix sp. AUS1_2]|nr:hypothetical protein [Candidatus Electrothrix sp. AUS1_2]
MLVFSHRGFHKKHRENTIDAFNSSLFFGIDGIETDVRISLDNVPILFHDRLAPSLRSVSELTHADLNRELGLICSNII